MNIKAIETVYKGYHFRSRLEARWAVFFDALGLEWEYEPEGFDLGDGIYYLPDFLITGFCGNKCWVEIKADKPTPLEIEKGKKLAHGSKLPIYFLSKIPNTGRSYGFVYPDYLGLCSFVPVGCTQTPNDFTFTMFGHYTDNLPSFLKTVGFECNDDEIFDYDNRYHVAKYGRLHKEHCELGRFSDFHIELPYFIPEADLDRAIIAARSARFEHGQKGASL